MKVPEINNLVIAFSRYLNHINKNGFDEVIQTIHFKDTHAIFTLCDHQQETYDLDVYFSGLDGTLQIDNAINGASVYDFADEFHMTQADIDFIKTGVRSCVVSHKLITIEQVDSDMDFELN